VLVLPRFYDIHPASPRLTSSPLAIPAVESSPFTLFLSALLMPRPPTSTPIPYTTLFRSYDPMELFLDPAIRLPKLKVARRLIARDRKSTRLNSSHVKISYAVFCLKKKRPLLAQWPSC